MRSALEQSWPPFVLIAGLLVIGLIAERDGLFAWGGARLESLPGGALALLAAALALDALVTAVLNLDTAVVFLTPVLVYAARRRRVAVEPFLYGCVFMANASSLFLPGSNLTNLLVAGAEGGVGDSFAARMFPLALTAALVTAAGVAILFRRDLAGGDPDVGVATAGRKGSVRERAQPSGRPIPDREGTDPPVVLGTGLAATVVAVIVVLAVHRPETIALGVLAAALATAAVELVRARIGLADLRRVLGPPSLLAAFVLTVALGTLARHWAGPVELLDGASGPETAGLAALSSVLVNNLPSAALYSAHAVEHSRMLLLGLNVGPNLAVSGALSALLWFRAAREVGARPSPLEFSLRGTPLALVAMGAAVVVGMLTR